MGKFKQSSRPFQLISIDFIGPLPRSTRQNKYVLVITDWFSKFVSLFALREATADKVVTILEKDIFLMFGVPEIIIMDNGKQFTSKKLNNLLDNYNVKKVWFTSHYHPQNNFTERYNQVIGNCLRAYSKKNHRHWDAHLSHIQLALRTCISEVTGYTPFYLNFAREYIHAGNEYKELLDDENINYVDTIDEFQIIASEVQDKLRKAYEKNKFYYDKNRKKITFEVGEKVYRKNFQLSDASKFVSSKLLPKNLPFTVTRKISDLCYELADEAGKIVGNYHVKDIFKA